jgi:hypothetical protein
MNDHLKSLAFISVAALGMGALLLLTTNERSSEQFGICKRDSSGVTECLNTFTEEQWRFLGDVCDQKPSYRRALE